MGNNSTSIHHNYNNFSRKKPRRSLFLKSTTSTTTQSKWAAAATPTAPARAAPALRAPAPAANKQTLSPTDLREHYPPAPQSHSITSAFTIVFLIRETCKWIFSACVARHHGLQEWIGGQIDEDTRLKMEGKEHGLQQCTFASTCYS